MDATTDLERARRIAVALEQENARLRDLADTLAQRWDQMAASIDDTPEDWPEDERRRQHAAERAAQARIYRTAAGDLRNILEHDAIPHDLMTSEELGEPADTAGGAS